MEWMSLLERVRRYNKIMVPLRNPPAPLGWKRNRIPQLLQRVLTQVEMKKKASEKAKKELTEPTLPVCSEMYSALLIFSREQQRIV